jgi:predicted kinase
MEPYAQLSTLPPDRADRLDWPAVCASVPELAALGESTQDPIYHQEGDVLTHTRMVIEALVELDAYRQADAAGRFVLFYAALLHDIAKPSCAVQEGERIGNPGHSRRGAIDARVMLWRAGVPFALRERICQIIAHHQVPFFAINGLRSGESAEFIVRDLSWKLAFGECSAGLADLAAVAEADIRGRICADTQRTLDNIELFRELAREEGCYGGPRRFPDAHTRLMYCRSRGTLCLDYPFFQERGAQVTVLAGLPASGKNTWVENNAKGLPVVSFDDARAELGLKHGSHSGAAVQRALEKARICLRAQSPFVWNATHLSQQMRTKTLDLLYDYRAEVRIVYLEAPFKEIFRRNSGRNTTLTNRELEKMLLRWELPLATEAHHVEYRVDT